MKEAGQNSESNNRKIVFIPRLLRNSDVIRMELHLSVGSEVRHTTSCRHSSGVTLQS